MTFTQRAVIAQLNYYLKLKNRDLELSYGYCHGLTLLWLHSMSIKQERWFHFMLYEIVHCRTEEDFKLIEKNLEYFLSHLEWLQRSRFYTQEVNQLDIEKLTEWHQETAFSFLLKASQWEKVLLQLIVENKRIVLSNQNHTIGIFKRDGVIHLFDANYPNLQPKKIKDPGLVKNEIMRCLYQRTYLSNKQLPLHVSVFSACGPSQAVSSTTAICKQLIRESDGIDYPGLDGNRNLLLASEAGNDTEVKLLLDAGANPNQRGKNDWTAAHLAAARGYVSILDYLHSAGADFNLKDRFGNSPADIAEKLGYPSIADSLKP